MSKINLSAAMFTFNTYLWYNKNPKALSKAGEVSLYLRIYIGTKGCQETKDLKIHLKWPVDKIDLDKSKLLSRWVKDEDVNDYNLIILAERAKHNEIAKLYRLSGNRLTMKDFLREIQMFDFKKSLCAYMEMRRKELYKSKEISWQTYKNVASTIKTLLEYKDNIRFEEINPAWMTSFKSYLLRSKLSAGTVWTKMKDLKHYLRLANDEKVVYVDPAAYEFPNPEPPTVTTYLNRDELKRLFKLLDPDCLTSIEFSVLKAFLFTCFTSLRISDLYEAGNKMLIADNMLTFTAKKNRARRPKLIHIPLLPMARKLIDDSLQTFFVLPSEQEYNRTLKDLARKAKINKKLTSHVGRHTFGYLYMTTAGNLYGLKEILGHAKIETTERYAHLDDNYQFKQTLLIQEGFEGIMEKRLMQ